MGHLFTIPAGHSVAALSAQHVLSQVAREQLPHALLLLPTRRACHAMRQAFMPLLMGETSLLPRMVALADLESEWPLLVPDRFWHAMEAIPSAMPASQQRYVLAKAVRMFEEKRRASPVALDDALALADELMALQDDCARAGVALAPETLRPLLYADMATHWEQSLQFLGIVSARWADIEAEMGLTIAANREVRILQALSDLWQQQPPNFPVFVIGSTGSHEATARLMQVVATMASGYVMLPGIDGTMEEGEWQAITLGHPLFHVKNFCDRLSLSLPDTTPLASGKRSLWLDALANADAIPSWQQISLPAYDHIRLISCAHAEEEARVISLLLRETLEMPEKRVALITPDESLMARVAAHMQRYGVTVDRLSAGTLASTEAGSLWLALAEAMDDPSRMLLLRHLLHHPLLNLDDDFMQSIEPHWYGVMTHRPGQLPRLPDALRQHPQAALLQNTLREMADYTRSQRSVSEWIDACEHLLRQWGADSGSGQEALEEALETLRMADMFGPIASDEFLALLREVLREKWRDVALNAHPNLLMLTPAEARLQQFDRVILANMQECQWPGEYVPNAWLNMAAKAALGLPSPAERTSLMAHDMLMLASSGEVFLTYPRRHGGSPTTRSRFIERLVTLLATHGVEESTINAAQYVLWANALDTAYKFTPEPAIYPKPAANQRPHRFSVSSIDWLLTDPFAFYAEYVLKLKPINAIDAELEARDFGSLCHRAIEMLTKHWNSQNRIADKNELRAIADHALRDFSDRPQVALFWRTRLLRALEFVNQQEPLRRTQALQVDCEKEVEAALMLADDQPITLYGRIDRLEQAASAYSIVDYKAGTAPTAKNMIEGKDVQLLAYAMMLEARGDHVDEMGYWKLPHGPHAGDIRTVMMDALKAAGLTDQLRELLRTALAETTPFLARPNASNDRFDNDYDGISRYDEWAG